MIVYPAPLLSVGGAKSGLAPVNLLDVQTLAGNIYYWADRAIHNIPAAITSDGNPATVSYLPWGESVGEIQCFRSLQTDVFTMSIQNISGDSMQRDMERIMRSSAIEGALFVYRMWQADAGAAWHEMHGTLTMPESDDREVQLKGSGLLDAAETDGVPFVYSETCQLEWASARCGATGSIPCQNSFQSCQVVERFTGILNSFETNYGETTAVVSSYAINRRRKI